MILVKLVKAAVLALASLLLAASGYVAHTGVATVKLEQKAPDGVRLLVPVPMVVAHAALAAMPEEELRSLRRDVGPWAPVLVEVAEALEDVPDGLLVEVIERDERVVIRKEGRKLVVEVTTPAEEVRVKVPLRSLARLTETALGPGTI